MPGIGSTNPGFGSPAGILVYIRGSLCYDRYDCEYDWM